MYKSSNIRFKLHKVFANLLNHLANKAESDLMSVAFTCYTKQAAKVDALCEAVLQTDQQIATDLIELERLQAEAVARVEQEFRMKAKVVRSQRELARNAAIAAQEQLEIYCKDM